MGLIFLRPQLPNAGEWFGEKWSRKRDGPWSGVHLHWNMKGKVSEKLVWKEGWSLTSGISSGVLLCIPGRGLSLPTVSAVCRILRVDWKEEAKKIGRRLRLCSLPALFLSGFFRGRVNSGNFPERRCIMLVYGGLEEVSKDVTELVSTELQNAAISTIRTRTLVHTEDLSQ